MSDREWITTPITAELVRGAVELERTEHGLLPHRLPAWARAQCDDGQLLMAESQPAGVRLVFRSRATEVELDAHRVITRLRGRAASTGLLLRPLRRRRAGRADEHHRRRRGGAGLLGRGRDPAPGRAGTVRFAGLPGREKLVELWLPWSETTHLVELRTDAPVLPATSDRRVWLHHGSSISQGSVADEPQRHLARDRRRSAAASSWSTSASPAARCSTRSPPAPCGTPRPTWSASRSASTSSTST